MFHCHRFAPEERPVFTRIDPAVIMAITCGDWILLGRQERWSPGRYSLLAGHSLIPFLASEIHNCGEPFPKHASHAPNAPQAKLLCLDRALTLKTNRGACPSGLL